MILKEEAVFKASLILGMVLVVGIVGFFLFDELGDFTNYILFGELPLTGQVTGSPCDLHGGLCLTSCNGGENYISTYSCDNNEFSMEPGSLTINADVPPVEGSICCMPDTCGNGHEGFMEDCDDGANNGVLCDNSSSSCTYCNDSCDFVTLTYTSSSYCGDGTCDSNETCSSCLADCVDITGAPACEEGKVCEENFGIGICSVSNASSCGNNNIDSGEDCDLGTNNNGVICNASYEENCTYCSDGCLNVTLVGSFCGDSIINYGNSEVCDLNNLSDSTCVSLGFNSGDLTCLNDCSGFDNSSCVLNGTAVQVGFEDSLISVSTPSRGSSNSLDEEESNLTNDVEDLNYSLDGVYESPENDGTSNGDDSSGGELSDGDKESFSEDFGINDFSPEAITYRVKNALSSKWGIPIAIIILALIVLVILLS